MTSLSPLVETRRPTRHLPELPLPTATDVATDWGLGWQLEQALRQITVDKVKPAFGVLMSARCKLGPQETAGAERPPAEVVTAGRQRRQITADNYCEAWAIPRELRSVVGHIERVSKAKTALGAVEALDDALASLGNVISASEAA